MANDSKSTSPTTGMVQQNPISLHKIIFTITCDGETLYDAQKLAMNVSAVLEDGYRVIRPGVTIEMTVRDCSESLIASTDTNVYLSRMFIPGISTDNLTPVSWGNCECKRTVHENHCGLSNNIS